MSAKTVRSFCRICQAYCGVKVVVEDDRIIKITGDREDPVSKGYICFKGTQAADQHHGAGRLLKPLRRVGDDLVEGESEVLLAEAGTRLREIVEQSGPESVALFQGTQAIFNSLTMPGVGAFVSGIGTPRLFTTMTIDQSAKWIAEARLGGWHAGPQDFNEADAWMLFGSNPLVSMVTAGGANQFVIPNPVKTLRAKVAEGFKLIVIDPRRSETARFASLHLQPRPGFDAEIAAAMLHIILREGWHHAEFCQAYVDGVDELYAAVRRFDPAVVAERAGLDAQEIEEAARVFAQAKSGMAGTGTGPDMARFSNLAEHLVQSLNVVCGRFPREGERVANAGVLRPEQAPRAEVIPSHREWQTGPTSASHALGMIKGTMMSAEIADDILGADDRRIRALVCVGGNLAAALPDQEKAIAALEALDLLIVIDPRLTATAKAADYVFAPKLQYERPDHTGILEGMFLVPFAHVTAPIIEPPAGSDLVDDWFVLERLVEVVQGADTSNLNSNSLLQKYTAESNVPLQQVAAQEGAYIHEQNDVYVGAMQTPARFELLADDVAEELDSLGEELNTELTHAFSLTVRRHREVMNSTGTDYEATNKRFAGSPLYIHPSDMQTLGVDRGDLVAIVRANKKLRARAVPDSDLRPGVVAMSHGWSGEPGRPDVATNLLVDADRGAQSINRMPIMTGIEVSLIKE